MDEGESSPGRRGAGRPSIVARFAPSIVEWLRDQPELSSADILRRAFSSPATAAARCPLRPGQTLTRDEPAHELIRRREQSPSSAFFTASHAARCTACQAGLHGSKRLGNLEVMAAVAPARSKIDEARQRANDTRKLAADTRKLAADTRKALAASHRAFARSLAIYRDAQAKSRRLQERLDQSRSAIREHRRTAHRLHLLTSTKIDGGQLPDDVDSISYGAPGFGGECAACDRYMPATRMVMSIPHAGSFVYLHAECYMIWRAQCYLRSALRRIA